MKQISCRGGCLLGLLALWVAVGCQPSPTVSKITVRYDLGQAIAKAHLTNGSNHLATAEPRETLTATVQGDRTHPRSLEAELYEDTEAQNGDVVWLRIPSPGFSGTETLAVTQVAHTGQLLLMDYEKATPQENTADFRQFVTVVRVTFAKR